MAIHYFIIRNIGIVNSDLKFLLMFAAGLVAKQLLVRNRISLSVSALFQRLGFFMNTSCISNTQNILYFSLYLYSNILNVSDLNHFFQVEKRFLSLLIVCSTFCLFFFFFRKLYSIGIDGFLPLLKSFISV